MQKFEENEFIELKETTGELHEGVESIASILNKHGKGELYFGIKNSGKIVGQQIGNMTLQDVTRAITDNIEPKVYPEVNIIQLENEKNELKNCILVEFQGNEAPYLAYGRGFMRVGEEDKKISALELQNLFLKRTNFSFEAQKTDKEASDFSFTFLNATYKRATGNDFNINKDLVSAYLATNDGFLTNAGILFSDQPTLMQSKIVCTRWNGLTRASGLIDATDTKEYNGNIVSTLNDALRFIKTHNQVAWEKTATSRIEYASYNEKAYKEALTNAVIHRDYGIVGAEIHIDIFDDRMEIISPGGMVDGSLIQDLDWYEVPSLRRNNIIADMFLKLDLVEKRGSGLEKILYSVKDKNKVNFYSTNSYFKATFYNANYKNDVIKNDLDENIRISSEYHPNEKEKEILDIIAKNEGLSRKELVKISGYTEGQIKYYIATLKDKEKINVIGNGKNTIYGLKK